MTKLALYLLFSSLSSQTSLPPGLLSAVCYVESRHNAKAFNKLDGKTPSHGLCQVKLETAKFLGFSGTEKELQKPKVNAYYAAKYLKRQIDRYEGDIRKGIASYNSGSLKINERGLIKNRGYVIKVFKAWAEGR